MENASKALIIAGGVLIGVMILSLLVYMFSQSGSFADRQEREIALQQLQAFNQQYEAYALGDLTAADMVTLLNKARDNNEKYDIKDLPNHPYYINIEVMTGGDTYNEKTPIKNLYNLIKNYSGKTKTEKDVFKYVTDSIKYNEENRVCYMKFRYTTVSTY